MRSIADHALTRKQFGRPLKDFGLIQEKFVNMSIMSFVAESMAYMTTAHIDGTAIEREVGCCSLCLPAATVGLAALATTTLFASSPSLPFQHVFAG